MKKTLIVIFGIILSLSSGYYGFIYSIDKTKTNTLEVSADWADEFNTPEEMFQASDLVVIGKATAKKDKNNKDKTLQPFDFDEALIYTEYDFNIKYTLKGEQSLKKIDVINYGGVNSEGYTVEWEHIEKLENSNLYLVFLEYIPNDTGLENDPRAGKYRPISGIQGTYQIQSSDKKYLNKLLANDKLTKAELENEKLSLTVKDKAAIIQNKVEATGLKNILNFK
ncbi:hypothetical protein ACWE42_11205 [Sutcliffiella cohnii]